jgi:periplasmic protein TonB
MGYQALLFCPDEKTARTVTQVLSELEFTVEPCIEPFAAVKKLMGQHFDAVVVDCDNEQNATLLFKSARNSTSNQASLAVAVVEGQAGVAKAFRIGANLVLTKPINIEQTKGTLRVARGLLRKGDPTKPAASAPAASPAKPVAAKPASPAKPAALATPAAVSTLRPAAPTEAKSAPSAAWPATAAAIPAPAAHHSAASDDDVLEISLEAPAAAPPDEAPVFNKFGAAASSAATGKSAFNAGLPANHGSGSASAPAPAREVQASHVAEVSPAHTPAPPEVVADKPSEAAQGESSSYAGPAPLFTFGGANAPEKSSGGRNKIFLGIAAAGIVTAALYVGWTKFQGRETQPVSTPTQVTPAPVAAPHSPKPSSAKPAPTIPTSSAPTPTSSAKVPSSQPDAVATKGQAADTDSASDDASAPSSTKPSSSGSPGASKMDGEATPPAAPLVVKRGTATATHSKTTAADEAAPSMIGIASAGAGAPPPNLVSSAGSAPKPILQTLNVSQGVSRGLLLKKVQPAYPRNALSMRIEGAVELTATISKEGDITHIKIVSGDSQLTRAAAEAVKQWKYKPYLLNGEPVEIQTQVTINFKLPK